MASKDTKKDETKKKGKPIVLIALMLVIGIGGGAGGMWFMGKKGDGEAHAAEAGAEEAPAAPAGPATYVPMEPAFVVNLADEGGTRYLQADVQLMTRDPLAAAALEANAPALRNGLLLLFAQQYADRLRTREDKERLQTEALAEIQRIMTAETGSPAAEALYFTSFVTQ
ncbi:flagellar basal body-associated FliL family protein [Coralloluteibacterium stylophorae]|uniref:Flagellar protein FliL n=1 Tax=Coralloluteibacterium stylophorae TaxID=1776034 RepID=A0A8J7VWE3_9GAMM|nr:flagellar basal body-associated FliL family protein [Coralloluteibacterium stylophorae]MBS7457222.1 flagellar basal body-associated FliL family protein [Coralloluteibacterium stylophorae]